MNSNASRYLESVTLENAVLLLIDQQEGLLGRAYESEHTQRILLAMARCMQILKVPTIITVAGTSSPNGPLLKGLAEIYASQDVIERTLINAWQDQRVREAVKQSGRKKLLIAGTGLDICAQFPAISSLADGYDSYVVVDACGRFEPTPSVATVSRLTQAGAMLTNMRTVVLELMADNAYPQAKEIYTILSTAL